MSAKYLLFIAGFGISFFGSMAPGTLNMTTLQISVFNSVEAALTFAFGAVLIEMMYAALAVTLLHRIRIPLTLKRTVEWIFVMGLITYGAFIVYSTGINSPTPTIEKIEFTGSSFLFGVSLSLINPFQVPFWMFWGMLLKKRGILSSTKQSVGIYTLSAGIGAFSLLALYAVLGGSFRFWITAHQREFVLFYGSIFILLGGIQAYKNVKNKTKEPLSE
jgi:threonine/homoserine/homoserine lactone efflux protein